MSFDEAQAFLEPHGLQQVRIVDEAKRVLAEAAAAQWVRRMNEERHVAPPTIDLVRQYQLVLQQHGQSLTSGNVVQMLGKLYLHGSPYSVAVCQVRRSTVLHGSALVAGNVPLGLPNQRNVLLSELFDNENGENSIFTSMVGRYLERLFPLSLLASLTPNGSRIQASLPAGHFGNGPLDTSPITFAPQTVLPRLLLLEMRLAIGEAGWPQALFVAWWPVSQALSNDKIVYIGSRRSTIDIEGAFLAGRAQTGIRVAALLQLRTI